MKPDTPEPFFLIPDTHKVLRQIFRDHSIPFKHEGAWYGLTGRDDLKKALELIGEHEATIDDDIELLKKISGSVQAAMEALGDELFKYLEEAGRVWEEKKEMEEEKEEEKKLVRRLFGDFLAPKKPKKPKVEKPKKKDMVALENERKEAAADLQIRLFLAFKNFKKGHGMIMW